MAYIKKLVMHGFKSFARKTEIPFSKEINVIIGPNGSGKSNISDAICFVLGRLSAKSMRAEKGANLIFMGSKYIKPAKEAFVEIVFDNSDKSFNINSDEVRLARIVRIKGQSIYKINGETKTRVEVIETLAQAGIDPYGYNLILQGQIQSIVRMHSEERRKIIGEVAGISVYEWRKEKSLKELEKTDERLKEISTILRVRTEQLNNLERERTQAKKFKELELTIRRANATIKRKKLDEKQKEIQQISKAIEEKLEQKGKKVEKVEQMQQEIEEFSARINQINKKIKEATGIEQGKLREEITNTRAELEGLRVRKEGHENREEEFERRINQMSLSVPEMEMEIVDLKKSSPLMAKKTEELKKKKEELSELEKERKKVLSIRTELDSVKERIEDKRNELARATADSNSLINQIEKISKELTTKTEREAENSINTLSKSIEEERKKLENLNDGEIETEKIISVSESEIARNENIKKEVNQIDICPLCKSKITEEHIKHVFADCEGKINSAKDEMKKARASLEQIKKEELFRIKKIKEIEEELRNKEKELVIHKSAQEKTESIKTITMHIEKIRSALMEFEKKRKLLESKKENLSSIEERFRDVVLEIEEISSRTEENLDTTLMYKGREIEKTKSIIERSKQDLEDIKAIVAELESEIEQSESTLEEKEKKEIELNARFKQMFSDRDETQNKIQEKNLKLNEIESEIRQIEDQVNYLKVGRSKIDGERQVIEMDMREFLGVELLQGSVQALEEKLQRTQESLKQIGSINMRALEVYDEIKEEYDKVKEKADTIDKEKNEIMKIIEEIDKKKKNIFMKTFKGINELFSRNFSKLSLKGTAYLEFENQEDIFQGGVEIVVKMAKGKYFDVHSLSGGEQTLVAISLLFAIQEYKPYHFYILDEIDAALDKRNSERLAGLLNQYTKSGQYIIITHNDAIILDSNILYGISMHEGVSKIFSLKIK